MAETTVITFGNFKGGTGKTTNSTMMAYELSSMGYKVLLVDQDPQANATSLYLKTKNVLDGEIVTFDKTLMSAISEGDLRPIITNIKENLDLLPSFSDFALYPNYMEQKYPGDYKSRVRVFDSLLSEIKGDYDFVFIDVPPTIGLITDSALYASDGVVVVLQTHERSLQGSEIFLNYLTSIVDEYDTNLGMVGILPVLLKNDSRIDTAILNKAKEMFGEENVFNKVVKNRERLKRFDITGITDEDMHDRRVHVSYMDICEEFIQRLKG
ncbi:ParA family protein [Streptomyces sp. NPDC057927]